MIDHRGIIGYFVSCYNIILGMITLSNAAILVGIISGLAVAAKHIVDTIIRLKEYKRSKNVNRSNS